MASLAASGNILASLIELGILLAFPAWLISYAFSRSSKAIATYFLLLEIAVFAWTWLLSAVAVHNIWGTAGLCIGVLLGGVSVIPLSLLALLLHKHWFEFSGLIVQIVIFTTLQGGRTLLMNRIAVREYTKRGGPTAEQVAEFSAHIESMTTSFKENCAKLKESRSEVTN